MLGDVVTVAGGGVGVVGVLGVVGGAGGLDVGGGALVVGAELVGAGGGAELDGGLEDAAGAPTCCLVGIAALGALAR